MMFQPGNLTITGSYPKPNLRTLVKVHENSRDRINRCFNNLFVNSMHTTKVFCIKSQSYNLYAENLPTKLDALRWNVPFSTTISYPRSKPCLHSL